jgi:hypothetical protein
LNDPSRRSEPLRLDVVEPPSVVRVVLAEIGSPGPLHYLIEGEGFQVVGCASNDAELARVLTHVEPDVVVLDADISATSVLVAREEAPSSELIVLWPEGVQLPAGAERVHPRLVYQDLGPAIRRAANDRQNRHPVVIERDDEDLSAPAAPPRSVALPSSAAQRTSTRVLVGTAALIALIVMTMGASFALEGRTGAPQPSDTRTTEISPSATARPGRGPGATATSPPSRTGDARPSVATRCVPGAKTDHRAPNEHAAAAASHAHQACASTDRGSAHSAPHHHANGRGNGPTTGAGNPNAKGGGNANAKGGNAEGGGNANAKGGNAKGGGNANAKGSNAKGRGNANAEGGGNANAKGSDTVTDATAPGRSQDHPSGPPATPGAARNGPPG